MKKFAVWLPFVVLLVVLLNYFGLDEYNILLMGVSPVAWFIEFVPNMNHVHLSSFVVYIVAVVFWLLIGMLLDRLIIGLKKRSVQ
ncbi:hypothetical protein QPK24_19315 [Paenibacillus polygoni]|uniref:YfzA-like protein n=1 Tax=Paenibacillus polygoni TaxID=3050112 RepID=A0ABY8WZC4_9BACL|nr:hypothetical protein [Paenibacillus polygoni]WIV18500.1 hypothetical protein QPK24_19315 [Paenibacillus polygoni]